MNIPADIIAILLFILAAELVQIAWRDIQRLRAGRQKGPRWHLRMPLFLLRALTWRKRKRSTRCAFLADTVQAPLSQKELKAWAELKENLR